MSRVQRWRTLAVGSLLVCGFGGLAGRVVHLQLGEQTELRATCQKRKTYRKEFSGTRGRILDRNGRALALDVGQKHVAVDPKFIAKHSDPVRVQRALTSFLPLEPAMVAGRIGHTERQHLYVQKYVDGLKAEELRAYLDEQSLGGVVFTDVQARQYPHGSLMSHVIGFANREGVGSAGVEQKMDRFLREKRGMLLGEKDGRRRERVVRRQLQIDAQDGADVTLTLDQFMQHSVEEALDRVIELRNAKGAWAVVLDSKSGAVLAMASKPDFDPNTYFDADPEHRRNRTLCMVYEPGSIMKPLVFAAALNERLVNPNEMIDTEGGTWFYRRRPLRDFHGYTQLTAADVLKKSSNIGTAKIALRLGEARLEAYLRAFGLGSRSGIELPGEEAGIFYPHRKWDGLSLTRISIGHSISVTALQMAVAMNVIANDGKLIQPYILKEVKDQSGYVRYRHKPEILQEDVIRPEVAKEMRRLMARITEKGISRGTGWRAAIPGYKVAGKTGTAEKVENGRYSSSKNIASFVGFFPAENPVLTIVVSVDEPNADHNTGGYIAGPVFKEIGENAIRYLGIPPEGF